MNEETRDPAAPAGDGWSDDGLPTTSPAPGHSAALADPGATPRPSGAGRAVAAVLALALAFGAGMAVDRAAGGGASRGRGVAIASATPVAVPRTTAPTPPEATPRSPTSGSPGSATATPASSDPTPPPTPSPIPPSPPPGASPPPAFELFWEALALLREHYVQQGAIDDKELTYGAIRGMLDALRDTGHTGFLTPEQRKASEQSLQGILVGIGVVLGREGGFPVVETVLRQGPAAEAGIRGGDRILAVDGESVVGLTDEDIAERVRGEEGTPLRLRLSRPGADAPYDVTLTRRRITIPAVAWGRIPETGFAHVAVTHFGQGAAEQLARAVRQALDGGAEGIVLDLRDNPGGLVDEAVGVASQFLRQGTVYIRQGQDGGRIPVEVRPGGIATDVPLVVLVNGGSASSAEIVAGALRDAGRARLIGTRTVGTGTVVLTYGLSDGSAIRVGVEQWLTPRGDEIWREGIAPDEELELLPTGRVVAPDELAELGLEGVRAAGDEQLLRAIERLRGS